MFTVAACVACQGGFGHASNEREQQHMQPPEAVTSFDVLYQKNCAGCHGADGKFGAATNLANPVYQALIDDNTLRDVIRDGQKGTMMPGFGRSAGGDLTDEQVKALVQGVRKQWSKGNVLQGTTAPPYKAASVGDPTRGAQVYAMDCARCHGPEIGPPGKAGAILDRTFLALVADQTLRTTAIAGRPDLGMPDFRSRLPGHTFSDQEITDVVAFVASHRPKLPGQTYPQPKPTQAVSGAQDNAAVTAQGKQ